MSTSTTAEYNIETRLPMLLVDPERARLGLNLPLALRELLARELPRGQHALLVGDGGRESALRVHRHRHQVQVAVVVLGARVDELHHLLVDPERGARLHLLDEVDQVVRLRTNQAVQSG